MWFSLLVVQDLPTRNLDRFQGDHGHCITPTLSWSFILENFILENMPLILEVVDEILETQFKHKHM